MGTGTSQGVPMIGCDCAVCRSKDPRNRRYRTHVHVEMGGLNIQVDAAPEFRLQAIELRIPKIDLAILTHGHADHLLGFDDLRRYCDMREGEALPVYSNEDGLDRLKAVFPYAMRDKAAIRGYPAFRGELMPRTLDLREAGEIDSTTQSHGRFETLGLVFRERRTGYRFAYFTDCDSVGPEAEAIAKGADLVVLDGLRTKPHPSHMSIDEAVAAAERIGGKRTLLIHMTHELDHDALARLLPDGVEPAYDGLVISSE